MKLYAKRLPCYGTMAVKKDKKTIVRLLRMQDFFRWSFCVFSFPPRFCTFHASSLLEVKLTETFSTHVCIRYSLQNTMKLLQYYFCNRGLCFMLQLPLLWQEGVPPLSVPMEGHVWSIFWMCHFVCEFFQSLFCVARRKENPLPVYMYLRMCVFDCAYLCVWTLINLLLLDGFFFYFKVSLWVSWSSMHWSHWSVVCTALYNLCIIDNTIMN